MKLEFNGTCSGTESKISNKTKTEYKVTRFVEFPSMRVFDVFGDLGLPPVLVSSRFVLDAEVGDLKNVKVLESPKPVK